MHRTLRRFWHADYFDRYMRDEGHLARTTDYVENNPVKARSCCECGRMALEFGAIHARHERAGRPRSAQAFGLLLDMSGPEARARAA